MRIAIPSVAALAACVFLTSCASARVQKDLASSFAQMREAGKIPGLSPDGHGHLRTEGMRIGQPVTYPFSQKVYAYPKGDPAVYVYCFTKDGTNSDWQLTSASRTFRDGRHEDLKIQ